MKTLDEVTGKEVVTRYCEMQNEHFLQDEFEHFTEVYNNWLDGLRNGEVPCKLSLNKRSYLGKKTRALLDVMGVDEPRTLKELIKILKV